MRLFIGIKFEENIIAGLYSLQNEIRKLVKSGKFPTRENLHLTLHFLGETPENRIKEISESLSAVSKAHRPFLLSFSDQLGYFGQTNPVRVVWLGMKGNCTALVQLQASIAAAMNGPGVAQLEGRAYEPHVTLAREANFINSGILLKNKRIECSFETVPVICVSQFTLFSSNVGQGKLVYRTVESFQLDQDTQK
jgi:2'-5' RNA ligase